MRTDPQRLARFVEPERVLLFLGASDTVVPAATGRSLRTALGDRTQVTQLDEVSLLVTGPADASTLARISAWCQDHGVLPESLTLGQRTLEDVFLELTGRELSA